MNATGRRRSRSAVQAGAGPFLSGAKVFSARNNLWHSANIPPGQLAECGTPPASPLQMVGFLVPRRRSCRRCAGRNDFEPVFFCQPFDQGRIVAYTLVNRESLDPIRDRVVWIYPLDIPGRKKRLPPQCRGRGCPRQGPPCVADASVGVCHPPRDANTMRLRVYLWRLGLLPVALLPPQPRRCPASAPTDGRSPSVRQTEIARALTRGQRLETNAAGAKHSRFMKTPLRQFPAARHIEQRLQLCRIHYDLSRRYGDRGFRETIAGLSPRQALDLYSEVLLKIQAHYVDTPDWRRLADYGLTSLQVALADPLFLQANLPNAPLDRRSRRRARSGQHRSCEQPPRLPPKSLRSWPASAAMSWACRKRPAFTNTSVVRPIRSTLTRRSSRPSQLQRGLLADRRQLRRAGRRAEVGPRGTVDRQGHSGQSGAARRASSTGDRIVAVDGRSTAELTTDQAANLLQGKEGS